MRRPAPLRAWLPLAAALLLAACGGDRAPRAGGDGDATSADPATGLPVDASGQVDLNRIGYSRGSPDAPITVIEFSDFGCPYCAQFAQLTYPELQREFIENGQIRWRFVPFVLGIFPNGQEAARASECAGDQQQFWPMHDLLFERQGEWRASDAPEPLFTGYARGLGLDERSFSACFRENRPGPRLEAYQQLATQLGFRATPSFLVDGRPIQGALPLDQFRMILGWAGAQGQPAQ